MRTLMSLLAIGAMSPGPLLLLAAILTARQEQRAERARGNLPVRMIVRSH